MLYKKGDILFKELRHWLTQQQDEAEQGTRRTGENSGHSVLYSYNSKNLLVRHRETFDNVTQTVYYGYDEYDRLEYVKCGPNKETYDYDDFGRLSASTLTHGGAEVMKETYGYRDTSTTTTGQVSTLTITTPAHIRQITPTPTIPTAISRPSQTLPAPPHTITTPPTSFTGRITRRRARPGSIPMITAATSSARQSTPTPPEPLERLWIPFYRNV